MNWSPSSQHSPHGSINSFLAGPVFFNLYQSWRYFYIYLFMHACVWMTKWECVCVCVRGGGGRGREGEREGGRGREKHTHEYRCPRRPGQGVGSPEAGITGYCAAPDMGARNQTWSSGTAARAPTHWAISPSWSYSCTFWKRHLDQNVYNWCWRQCEIETSF